MIDTEASMVWALPRKSQEFMEPPSLTQRGDQLDLVYDYETDSGQYQRAAISFRGVEAFSFTSFELCSPEQVAAYDKVIAIHSSEWLKRLRSQRAIKEGTVLHYRMFFDEVGCYEIIASEFHPPTRAV